MLPCTYPTLIVGRLPKFTLPVRTSIAVIFSNLHNVFTPTLNLDQLLILRLRTQPHPTSNLTVTFILPMTTHTHPMMNALVSLAFPSRSWVMNSTTFYTAPILPPSLSLPSSALPVLFAALTSVLGSNTPQSNKLLFSLDPTPLNYFANKTKHGLTLPPLCAHNLSTHFNHTFSNANPQHLLARTAPQLLLCKPPL